MESAGEISLKRELLMRATSLDLTLPSNVGRGRSLKSLVLAKTAGTSAPLTSRKILSQISFELLVGDSLSIIGKNGSGKSSLLRVLSGIFTPSSGLIDGKPKIVPLIELEGAFNGELTVSENITLLLIILGVPQERFNLRNIQKFNYCCITVFKCGKGFGGKFEFIKDEQTCGRF